MASSSPSGGARTASPPPDIPAGSEPVIAREALGGRVRHGLRWSLTGIVIGRAGTFLTGIVLARLLVPEDYGVFAVAQVAFLAVTSIDELGVTLAIVRHQGDIRRIAPTVTTISMVSSTLLYGICFIGAPRFASALGAPQATGVVRLMCVGVIIDGITAPLVAQLQRHFRQDRRAAVDLSNMGVGTSLQIGLAAAGFGPWSIAWGRLAGNAVSMVLLLCLVPVRYLPGWDRSVAGELLRFGVPLAGGSLLVFAVLNTDYVVVGSLLGPVALGAYVLAFNLSSWPVNVFSMAVRSVSLAGFSKLQDDLPAMRKSFANALAWVSTASFPVCALLATMATPIVDVVYGTRWEPGAAALRFLAILGAFRVSFELVYDYLVAAGRSATVLRLQAVWFVALVPALAVGAHLDGIQGVGIGHAVVVATVMTPAALVSLHALGIGPRLVVGGLGRPLVGATAVVAAGLVAERVTSTSLLQLAVGVPLAVAVYAAIALRPVVAGVAARATRTRAERGDRAKEPIRYDDPEPAAAALSGTGMSADTAPDRGCHGDD